MSIFRSGCGERTKAGVHAALGVLALLCCGYNTVAYLVRGERHLWVNAMLYGAVTMWEYEHVKHHIRGRL